MYPDFLLHFFRNPKNVGALAPLSSHVAKSLIEPIHQRPDKKPWNILEVGAGTGSVTRHLLSAMQTNDQLDVIEIDRTCCDLLEKNYGNDSRMAVHCQSILDWWPDKHYDCIISTLPFNSFAPELVAQILNQYEKISKPGAAYLYVEYMGLQCLNKAFANKQTRQIMKERRRIVTNFQRQHLNSKERVFWNFLPCYVYNLSLNIQTPTRKKSIR